jgi:hypothetical protein
LVNRGKNALGRPHNPKVAGSNPAPATKKNQWLTEKFFEPFLFCAPGREGGDLSMRKVHDRLYVGSLRDCSAHKDGWAVVHACKTPCHQKAVGCQGSLPNRHPHYYSMRARITLTATSRSSPERFTHRVHQ